MSEYIGRHITEETWPEAQAILDAFRVGYRTTPDRYEKHRSGDRSARTISLFTA